MHEIIIAELSSLNVTDGEVLPYLLKQTRRRIKCNIRRWCIWHKTMLRTSLY